MSNLNYFRHSRWLTVSHPADVIVLIVHMRIISFDP